MSFAVFLLLLLFLVFFVIVVVIAVSLLLLLIQVTSIDFSSFSLSLFCSRARALSLSFLNEYLLAFAQCNSSDERRTMSLQIYCYKHKKNEFCDDQLIIVSPV